MLELAYKKHISMNLNTGMKGEMLAYQILNIILVQKIIPNFFNPLKKSAHFCALWEGFLIFLFIWGWVVRRPALLFLLWGISKCSLRRPHAAGGAAAALSCPITTLPALRATGADGSPTTTHSIASHVPWGSLAQRPVDNYVSTLYYKESSSYSTAIL